MLQGFGQRERLASSADYQQMLAVMDKLAPGERSGWAFGRSDEELRPTFDLIREGRMPESKSMMGKLLNNILTTEADRKSGIAAQAADRRREPARLRSGAPLLRPARGRVVRSEPDGWFITRRGAE